MADPSDADGAVAGEGDDANGAAAAADVPVAGEATLSQEKTAPTEKKRRGRPPKQSGPSNVDSKYSAAAAGRGKCQSPKPKAPKAGRRAAAAAAEVKAAAAVPDLGSGDSDGVGSGDSDSDWTENVKSSGDHRAHRSRRSRRGRGGAESSILSDLRHAARPAASDRVNGSRSDGSYVSDRDRSGISSYSDFSESSFSDSDSLDRKRNRSSAVASDRDRVSLSDELLAPVVLAQIKASGGTALKFVENKPFSVVRNRNECLHLASFIDEYCTHRNSGGRRFSRASHLLEMIVRRLVGVMSADRTGNWRMADVLSLKLSNDSLLSRDLELRLMQEANRLERATKTADKRAIQNSNEQSGYTRRSTATGGSSSYFGRRSKRTVPAGNSGVSRAPSHGKRNPVAAAGPSSRGRKRRGGGGGGDQ